MKIASLLNASWVRFNRRRGDRSGAVLALVLVVMVVFSLACLGLLKQGEAGAVEVAKRRNNLQVFWAAEAGMARAIARLSVDPVFRKTPEPFKELIGNLPYVVEFKHDAATYGILATSQSSDWKRTLYQVVNMLPESWHSTFLNYAYYGDSGSLNLEGTATISGAYYQSAGSSHPGAPTMPLLDSSYYQLEIATADASGISPPGPVINLAGGDVYIKGNVDLVQVTGPGRLIVKGDLKTQENAMVGDDVMLIASQVIELRTNTTIGQRNTFYSEGNFKGGDYVQYGFGNTVLCPNDVNLRKNASFRGAVYAGKKLTLEDNTRMAGSAVAGGGATLKTGVFLLHDPSQLPPNPPPGLEGGDLYRAERLEWKEL